MGSQHALLEQFERLPQRPKIAQSAQESPESPASVPPANNANESADVDVTRDVIEGRMSPDSFGSATPPPELNLPRVRDANDKDVMNGLCNAAFAPPNHFGSSSKPVRGFGCISITKGQQMLSTYRPASPSSNGRTRPQSGLIRGSARSHVPRVPSPESRTSRPESPAYGELVPVRRAG